MLLIDGSRRVAPPPPPPPPPPPAPAPSNGPGTTAVTPVRYDAPAADAAAPERYVDHTVARGETLTEISTRYQLPVLQLETENPSIDDADALNEGQTVRVPIGPGYGIEPVAVQIAPGQTLAELAAQYRQPLSDIVDANRHGLGNADVIHVGQQIWIPGVQQVPAQAPAAPLTPLEQAAQTTDAAAQRVATAQQRYDDMAASTNGSGAALPYFAQGLADAKKELDTAVGAELDLRVQSNLPPGHSATEANYEYAAGVIADRQASAGTTRATADAIRHVTIDRQTEAIVSNAQAASDPQAAVKALNDGYVNASPEVQQRLLASDGAKAIIDAANTWALEPLTQDPFEQMSPYSLSYQAMERLDTMTAGMAPEFAARVVANAVPRIEKYVNEVGSQMGGSGFEQGAVEHLTALLGRVAGTPAGDAAIERIVPLGAWNRNGLISAIANGASPAYALAIAKQPGVDAATVLSEVQSAMGIYRDTVAEHTKAYGQQMEELGWLVQNHGSTMTPEQLDQAIADYIAEKGPEWEAKTEELRQQLATDGANLLAQMQALQNAGLPDQQGQIDEIIESTFNDTNSQLAISTALQTKPELTQGVRGDQLLGFFTSTGFASNAKLSDQARRFAVEAATAYVKSNVLTQIGQFDPSDPASVTRATNAIESLRNTNLAKALGVSPDALDEAVDAIRKSVPVPGESADDIAARLLRQGKELDGISGFDKTTLAGQMLRTVGLGLAGIGFLASIERAGLDPNLRNDLRVLVDAAGLGQKGAELLVGLGAADDAGAVGKLGSTAASKFLGVLTAALDTWSAIDAGMKGDVPSAVLYGVGAGGGLLAAFGSGSLAGPIGIGLVVVSVLGLSIWNGIKEANKHEPDSDGGASMRFLQHAGFSESAARALVDQSGDGHSAVPLLERYAQLKGLDLTQTADRDTFVAWVNGMSGDQLGALRDNLHRTLDEFDGDVSRFNATADDDPWVVPDTAQRPWFAAGGDAQPESAAQLDAVLAVLEIPTLQP